MDWFPWMLAFLWMAIAIGSMIQVRQSRKHADDLYKRLQESNALTSSVIDKWNKTIADYRRLVDSLSNASR